MSNLFLNQMNFNDNISNWDVSNVKNMIHIILFKYYIKKIDLYL